MEENLNALASHLGDAMTDEVVSAVADSGELSREQTQMIAEQLGMTQEDVMNGAEYMRESYAESFRAASRAYGVDEGYW